MIRETVYPTQESHADVKKVLTAEGFRSQDIDPNPFSYDMKKGSDGTVYYMHKKTKYTISESKYRSLVSEYLEKSESDMDQNPFSFYRVEASDGTVLYIDKKTGQHLISESTYRSLVNKKELEDDKKDMVNHPPHYRQGNFEVIDIIKAFTSDLVGIEAVDTANAIKYILRWKHKNGVEDLEKARWYINHLIKTIKETK